jgi:hypothetical protein
LRREDFPTLGRPTIAMTGSWGMEGVFGGGPAMSNARQDAEKSETRNPKSESSPNDETRMTKQEGCLRQSGFGFDSGFWFRASGFAR